MFEPVPVGDGQHRDNGYRQEYPCDAREFVAREYGEYDGERVQVNAGAYDARVEHVVLNDAQDA